MVSLINETKEDAYHGRKLRKLLTSIATDGRYVNFFSSFPFTFIYIVGNMHHVVVATLGAVDLRLD